MRFETQRAVLATFGPRDHEATLSADSYHRIAASGTRADISGLLPVVRV
ncbi:hypothetical protein ACFQ1S_22935 [Kibdelosporangium lantanae]|uniref:Uncharacterized protein n=1 Tax=Kibdelosporangium lantanae TaxID=1497396 RepID=A0ABW3MG90_9PSEU